MPSTLSKRQRYEGVLATLKTERASFDADWREVADYIFPVRFRTMTTARNKGTRLTQKIIDSTATFAMNTLRAGLHAGVTSPARPWMKLSTPDPSLAKQPAVKQWLFDVTSRMHQIFQLSNLYNALPLVYGDMAVFGTAAVGVLDDPGTAGKPGDLFRCYPYPIGSYVLGMDNRGLVTTFVREYVKTVGQLVEEFGGPDGQPLEAGGDPDWSRFSKHVKDLWDKSQYETPVEVCWYVMPNHERDPGALGARSLPWVSVHLEKTGETDVCLRESGFREFPILAPRWFANAEETYGTASPGIDALGDVKQLQSQQRVKAKALAKMVDPPLTGPHSLRTQKVSLIPGDVTYDDVREGKAGIRPIHEVRPDLGHFVQDIQEVQFRIERAFHVDLFQMLSRMDAQRGAQPVTAREIDERHEEKLLVLGPVLESTIDELLDPLIDRVFAMMERAGLIPDAPPDLDGVELTVEYVSILAQAQKLVQVATTDRFVQTVGGMAAIFPQVAHKLNVNAIVDAYQDNLGTDPNFVVSDEEAEASMAAQVQAQQQQMAAEQIQRVGQGAAALANASMEGDTALSRIAGGLAG